MTFVQFFHSLALNCLTWFAWFPRQTGKISPASPKPVFEDKRANRNMINDLKFLETWVMNWLVVYGQKNWFNSIHCLISWYDLYSSLDLCLKYSLTTPIGCNNINLSQKEYILRGQWRKLEAGILFSTEIRLAIRFKDLPSHTELRKAVNRENLVHGHVPEKCGHFS